MCQVFVQTLCELAWRRTVPDRPSDERSSPATTGHQVAADARDRGLRGLSTLHTEWRVWTHWLAAPRRWSRRSDSNRGPAVYETAALPLSYAGAVQRIAAEPGLAACRSGLHGRIGGLVWHFGTGRISAVGCRPGSPNHPAPQRIVAGRQLTHKYLTTQPDSDAFLIGRDACRAYCPITAREAPQT